MSLGTAWRAMADAVATYFRAPIWGCALLLGAPYSDCSTGASGYKRQLGMVSNERAGRAMLLQTYLPAPRTKFRRARPY